MHSSRSFFLLLLFGLSGAAWCGCPPGTYQESTRDVVYCVPLPGQQPQQNGQGPEWLTRWGAVAVGISPHGTAFGASKEMKSKRAAEKAALKECKSDGQGAACKIEMTYFNQCGAVAWGNDFFQTARAVSIEDASRIAMNICEDKTQNCRVYYSGCSYPLRVR